MRLFIAFALLTFFSFGSFAQLKVIQYQLDNGFTVYLNPDPSINDITGAVAVNTGSKNDPIDATGMSHYLEHLLFKGTAELGTINFEKEKVHLDSIYYYYDELGKTTDEKERAAIQQQINYHSIEAGKFAMPNEFDKLLKSIGSTRVNATTSPDLTIYFNTFPAHQVPKWVNLYAHRFIDPVFRSFQSELEVVYEEKNRAMDDMQRRILETFNESFYKGHPYGEKNNLGKIEHLKNPSLTKMYEYFRHYYIANNMALILIGNFNVEEVKPLIEKEFGQLKSGKLPENNISPPQNLAGRVVEKARITPIKVGIYGFRTVPNHHLDEPVLDVISYLLQNEAGTGLIDQMVDNNELMLAYSFGENTDEAGSHTFVLLPKVFIQSFKKAEKKLFAQLERLKSGDFSDNLLQSVKNAAYKDIQQRIERPANRGYMIADAFRSGLSWEELMKEEQAIQSVTKEDIMKAAQKYFDSNYFAFLSRTGFPKKQKLSKPNFKPLKVQQDSSSLYAKKFDKLPETLPSSRFIDFDKDLTIKTLGKNSKLFVVNNPTNDIYELEIKFHIGQAKEPKLLPLAQFMKYAYPSNSSLSEFKEQLGLLGSNLSFLSSGSSFTLKLNGIEQQLDEVFSKINDLLATPAFEASGLESMYKSVKTNRKQEETNGLLIARAMAQYGLYGDKSILKNRLSTAEIKKLSLQDYKMLFEQVKNNSVSIHFTGKTKASEIEQLINNHIQLKYDAESEYPTTIPLVERTQNEVLIVDNKDLVQSHLFFVKTSDEFKNDNLAVTNLFNQYFDGGFSGILTQEVREYRSLAYSSTAKYDFTLSDRPEAYFYTYIGTQGDKTNASAKLTNDLINKIPLKPERMDLVRKNVVLKNQSTFPSFRNLSQTVEQYLIRGITTDPNIEASKEYKNIDFNKLIEFYQKEIQVKPTFLGIHGDADRFNLKDLEEIGKVKVIKREEVIQF